ncbi:hypothetical protein FNB15_03765 [Ferrovibrio terrae]|uniref:Uncharacterized protein n=1 Tax=Ferrovibrio terrae TaxID=2594003 RepID=A0A516GY71_9PROT|nr:hypothetical protein [Ferrovibrio terrae]QDO96442.1 hypothetical protein FNB15_03765 [Ferrovibrio terrae]
MSATPTTYAFAIQYGLGELQFDLQLAEALMFSNMANRMMAGEGLPFADFRLQMWDMLANSIEAGDHLKGGAEANAMAMGAAWLALTSAMHRDHPARDCFVLKLGARAGEIGVEIAADNPYAEPHDERGQIFAVANVTRELFDQDTQMFRDWASGIQAEMAKASNDFGH